MNFRPIDSRHAIRRPLRPRRTIRHIGHLRFGVYPHAAHNVMGRWAYFHRLLGDVEVGELHELMIHARELLSNMFRGVRKLLLDPRNVEKHASVGTAATGFDFIHDAARRSRVRSSGGRRAFLSPCV